jgi:hypothetical protein
MSIREKNGAFMIDISLGYKKGQQQRRVRKLFYGTLRDAERYEKQLSVALGKSPLCYTETQVAQIKKRQLSEDVLHFFNLHHRENEEQEEIGYIYFCLVSEAHIKIGFTKKAPFQRIKLQKTFISFPIKILLILPGNREAEQEIHRQFLHLKREANGTKEIFEYDNEIREFIKKEWIKIIDAF